MTDKWKINPARLKWCLSDDGITLEDVGKGCGIAISTLRRAMNGEPALTFKQLRRISDYFYYEPSLFTQDGEIRPEIMQTPKFRTVGNGKPRVDFHTRVFIRRIEWLREIYLGLSEDMEDITHYQSPLRAAGKAGKQDVKRAAAVARDWLGLSEQNDFLSLRRAVERKGILVVVTNAYPGVWRLPRKQGAIGFVLSYDQVPVIVVRKQASEKRQAFTLMHELGHLLLHSENMIDDEKSVDSNRGEEREANEFASCLLAPDEFINQIDVAGLLAVKAPAAQRKLLREYSDRWCVSIEAILLRLVSEGKLDRRMYARCKKHVVGARERRVKNAPAKPMPKPLGIFGGMYVAIVLDSMHSDEISRFKALVYLHITLNEMRELEAYKYHV